MTTEQDIAISKVVDAWTLNSDFDEVDRTDRRMVKYLIRKLFPELAKSLDHITPMTRYISVDNTTAERDSK